MLESSPSPVARPSDSVPKKYLLFLSGGEVIADKIYWPTQDPNEAGIRPVETNINVTGMVVENVQIHAVYYYMDQLMYVFTLAPGVVLNPGSMDSVKIQSIIEATFPGVDTTSYGAQWSVIQLAALVDLPTIKQGEKPYFEEIVAGSAGGSSLGDFMTMVS